MDIISLLYHPDITDHLKPLEKIIHTKFVPAMTGRPTPSNAERDLLALPATKRSSDEFSASIKITIPLKALLSEKKKDTYSAETK